MNACLWSPVLFFIHALANGRPRFLGIGAQRAPGGKPEVVIFNVWLSGGSEVIVADNRKAMDKVSQTLTPSLLCHWQ